MLHSRWLISLTAVAVLICFCPARGAAAEKTAVDKYSEILSTLDSSNLDSIEEATKAYQKLFAEKSDLAAQEKAHDEWSQFVREVIDVELGRIIKSGLYYKIGADYPTLYVEPHKYMEPEAQQYLADLRKRGLAAQQAAESTEIVVRHSYTKDNFFPYLSDRSKSIITLGNDYDEENFKYGDEDPPFEIQRKWIIKFEVFVKKYPSTFEEKVQGMVHRYVSSGVEEGVVAADQKISFQQFLTENKDSRYYPLIKEYYQYLETHQFRPNIEVARKLLKKYNQLIKH
jgi:hypothetical protein